MTVDSVEPADGVTSDMKREGERVVSITWTVTIDPGQNREFVFVAKNPSCTTEIVWKVHQRYADGTSSEWVGAAGTRHPAPVTKLTASTAPAPAGSGPMVGAEAARSGKMLRVPLVEDASELRVPLPKAAAASSRSTPAAGSPTSSYPASQEIQPLAGLVCQK